jgi:hypothetical protein
MYGEGREEGSTKCKMVSRNGALVFQLNCAELSKESHVVIVLVIFVCRAGGGRG